MIEAINYDELYFSPDTRRLKQLCWCSLSISIILLGLFLFFGLQAGGFEFRAEVISFIAMHIIDILLAVVVLQLINDARLNRTPSIKKQFAYLFMVYLALFSLVIHLDLLYTLYKSFRWLYMAAAFLNFSKAVFPFFILSILLLNTLLIPLVQISSFKFVKKLRRAGEVQITGIDE
ncbi:MAG: hypothetical protein QM791_11840 [Ferruginibacter sp.]